MPGVEYIYSMKIPEGDEDRGPQFQGPDTAGIAGYH